jgi:hypothetical protein
MSGAVNAHTDGNVTAAHAISADDVVKRFATSAEKGLDADEAAARLQKYGPNRLPEGKTRGPFMRFLAQFNNILVYVLLGAGFVKLMLNLWVDAGIIFAVVILNALLGFIQEGKAEKALDSIRNMLSAEARVVRGGKTRMLPADQLVPGDVVLLESGDKTPADLRLLDAPARRVSHLHRSERRGWRRMLQHRDRARCDRRRARSSMWCEALTGSSIPRCDGRICCFAERVSNSDRYRRLLRRGVGPRARSIWSACRSSLAGSCGYRITRGYCASLRLLERHTHRSGKDTVDRPKGGHDDHRDDRCS